MKNADKSQNQAALDHHIAQAYSNPYTHPYSQSYDELYKQHENTWLWKASRLLFPGKCLLCHGRARFSLCLACLKDLPCLASHCYRCAIPLSVLNALDTTATNNRKTIECGACQANPPNFDKSISAFEYGFPVDRLIHTFKNSGDLRLGKLLSALLITRLKQDFAVNYDEHNIHSLDIKESHIKAVEVKEHRFTLPEYIIPVAMHRSKKLKRQFNQAEFIAKELSKALDIPTKNIFEKTKETQDQHVLNRKERIKNLKSCFSVKPTKGILLNKNNKKIKHIAIVDDVMTTGTTTNELSKLLKQHGVEKVEVWTLARTPNRVNS